MTPAAAVLVSVEIRGAEEERRSAEGARAWLGNGEGSFSLHEAP